MRKFLVGILILMVLAILLPLSVSAQSYCRKNFRGNSARYSNAYYGDNGRRYRNSRANYRRTYNRRPVYYSESRPAFYTTYSTRRPSFYRRHRNVINMAIGTGAGAVAGGLLGGRRGVAWGSLTGAGASALYTYKIRPKKRSY